MKSYQLSPKDEVTDSDISLITLTPEEFNRLNLSREYLDIKQPVLGNIEGVFWLDMPIEKCMRMERFTWPVNLQFRVFNCKGKQLPECVWTSEGVMDDFIYDPSISRLCIIIFEITANGRKYVPWNNKSDFTATLEITVSPTITIGNTTLEKSTLKGIGVMIALCIGSGFVGFLFGSKLSVDHESWCKIGRVAGSIADMTL